MNNYNNQAEVLLKIRDNSLEASKNISQYQKKLEALSKQIQDFNKQKVLFAPTKNELNNFYKQQKQQLDLHTQQSIKSLRMQESEYIKIEKNKQKQKDIQFERNKKNLMYQENLQQKLLQFRRDLRYNPEQFFQNGVKNQFKIGANQTQWDTRKKITTKAENALQDAFYKQKKALEQKTFNQELQERKMRMLKQISLDFEKGIIKTGRNNRDLGFDLNKLTPEQKLQLNKANNHIRNAVATQYQQISDKFAKTISKFSDTNVGFALKNTINPRRQMETMQRLNQMNILPQNKLIQNRYSSDPSQTLYQNAVAFGMIAGTAGGLINAATQRKDTRQRLMRGIQDEGATTYQELNKLSTPYLKDALYLANTYGISIQAAEEIMASNAKQITSNPAFSNNINAKQITSNPAFSNNIKMQRRDKQTLAAGMTEVALVSKVMMEELTPEQVGSFTGVMIDMIKRKNPNFTSKEVLGELQNKVGLVDLYGDMFAGVSAKTLINSSSKYSDIYGDKYKMENFMYAAAIAQNRNVKAEVSGSFQQNVFKKLTANKDYKERFQASNKDFIDFFMTEIVPEFQSEALKNAQQQLTNKDSLIYKAIQEQYKQIDLDTSIVDKQGAKNNFSKLKEEELMTQYITSKIQKITGSSLRMDAPTQALIAEAIVVNKAMSKIKQGLSLSDVEAKSLKAFTAQYDNTGANRFEISANIQKNDPLNLQQRYANAIFTMFGDIGEGIINSLNKTALKPEAFTNLGEMIKKNPLITDVITHLGIVLTGLAGYALTKSLGKIGRGAIFGETGISRMFGANIGQSGKGFGFLLNKNKNYTTYIDPATKQTMMRNNITGIVERDIKLTSATALTSAASSVVSNLMKVAGAAFIAYEAFQIFKAVMNNREDKRQFTNRDSFINFIADQNRSKPEFQDINTLEELYVKLGPDKFAAESLNFAINTMPNLTERKEFLANVQRNAGQDRLANKIKNTPLSDVDELFMAEALSRNNNYTEALKQKNLLLSRQTIDQIPKRLNEILPQDFEQALANNKLNLNPEQKDALFNAIAQNIFKKEMSTETGIKKEIQSYIEKYKNNPSAFTTGGELFLKKNQMEMPQFRGADELINNTKMTQGNTDALIQVTNALNRVAESFGGQTFTNPFSNVSNPNINQNMTRWNKTIPLEGF